MSVTSNGRLASYVSGPFNRAIDRVGSVRRVEPR